jgi:hypothetical protein
MLPQKWKFEVPIGSKWGKSGEVELWSHATTTNYSSSAPKGNNMVQFGGALLTRWRARSIDIVRKGIMKFEFNKKYIP